MECLGVLSDIIHKMNIIDWIAVFVFLIYCSLPFWQWLEFRLDVRDFGKDAAKEIRKNRRY